MRASPRTRRTFRRSVAAPARAVTRTRITSTIGWGRAAERVGVRGCGAGSGWPTSWSSRCAVAHERLGGAHGRLAGSGRGAQARTGPGPARAGDPGHASCATSPTGCRRSWRPTRSWSGPSRCSARCCRRRRRSWRATRSQAACGPCCAAPRASAGWPRRSTGSPPTSRRTSPTPPRSSRCSAPVCTRPAAVGDGGHQRGRPHRPAPHRLSQSTFFAPGNARTAAANAQHSGSPSAPSTTALTIAGATSPDSAIPSALITNACST